MSKFIKKFKRSLAIVLSITTFAWALGPVALLLPTQALAATAQAGDLIKMDGLASVYYLGADSKRYVFPNETTFMSWYGDFSSVKTIAQSELESYLLSGENVTIRPGTKLVKVTTNKKVYAVETGGVIKWIPDEVTATTLYGADWAKRVVDVPDAFFGNYTESATQISATAYPEGTLIKYAGSSDIYVVTSATATRKFASMDAFTANRYKEANIVTAPATITYTAGTDVAAAESALVDLSSTGVTPGNGGVVAGTGVTVSLSSATVAAQTIIAGQAIANLASFDFTAGSDGAVKVTSFKVKRTGISADATLANVYLYDGATRLTDNASVSSSYISWNNSAGIFTLAAGTTKTVTVKSDIAASTSGQTVGINLVAATDVATDGATVSGTFPVVGNLMSVASASNFATVNFNATTYPASDGTPTPQDDFELWRNTVDIGNRAVNMESISFRQIGSVLSADLKNFELYVDGVKVGDTVAALDANGYATFNLTASPKKLETGSRTIKVVADLIDGSTRTVSLSLRHAADVVLVDTEYNANVRATQGASSSTFSARSSATQTIAGGTLTITKKTDSASGNVVNNATGVSLGKFEFKAAGEPMKVETLRLSVTVSDGTIDEIRNGKVFANGVQVGSTADIYATDGTAATYTDYTLGSSLVVNPGTPVTVEITADAYDSDGTNNVTANDTLKVIIETGSSLNNAQKMNSLTYTTIPSSDVEGNTLTVKEGALTLSKYTSYNDHSAVAPKTAYKLGEWRLKCETTEAVNLTSFSLDFTGGTLNVPTKVSDAYIVYGASETSVKSTVASTTNTWTISKSIASGETITVALYGTVTSGSVGTTIGTLTVNGTAASSSATANSSATGGQTATWTTGSIATAVTAAPLSQVVYGNQMVETGNFEITATNDTYTLTEFAVKVADGSQTAIRGVYLYDGTTLLNTGGTSMDTYYATTTGMSLAIPANETKVVTVKLDLNNVSTGAATPGTDVQTILDTIKVRNSSGTESYVSTDRTANNIIVFKSYPIVTHEVVSDREIINGTSQSIYKFKVAPSAGGTIALKQMKFNLTWVDQGPAVAALELGTLKFYRGSEDITDNVEITDAAGTSAKTGGTALNESDGDAGLIIGFKNSEELVSAETSYSIRATAANFDSGTTSSDKVTITMKGDTAANSTKRYAVGTVADYKVWKLATAAAGTGATAYNFIWSDRSAIGHNATSGSSSADWANGYKIKNLDLDVTVMDKNP